MVVADTSIIYKWLREEDTRHVSLILLDKFLAGEQKVIAPDILLYELANVLSSKAELTLKDISAAWNLFVNFKIEIFNPTPDFFPKCLKFAKEHKVTVYDASYAILAQENNCDLFTADSKFVKAVNLPFVKHLSQYPLDTN